MRYQLRTSVSALIIAITLTGCGNPRDTEIPTLDRIESIRSSVDRLEEGEKKLFLDYLKRELFYLSPSQQKIRSLERVTIGQAIEAQKRWELEQANTQTQMQRRREEEAASQAAKEKALTETLHVLLIERKVIDLPGNADGLDKLEFRFVVENRSGRDLAGFHGLVRITDSLDNELAQLALSEQTPIKSGESRILREEAIVFAKQSLKTTPLDKLITKWRPQKFVFSDGRELNN